MREKVKRIYAGELFIERVLCPIDWKRQRQLAVYLHYTTTSTPIWRLHQVSLPESWNPELE